MNSTDFKQHGKAMVDYITNYLDNIGERKVFPDVEPGYLRDLVPANAPEKPEKWESIMEDVDKHIMPGITHWQHPRFHAYFPSGNSYPSIMGDMLSNAIGCIGFSWAASPACTELELIVTDWLAKMMSLPEEFLHSSGKGGGVIHGSASECILIAMLSARYKAIEEFKEQPGFNKNDFPHDAMILSKLVGYCSEQAHSSVEKAGMIAFTDIRQLPTDKRHSLRGDTLAKAIEKDIAEGRKPFFVSAVLGSTSCCSFDNLKELSKVCKEHNIWLHVDAAYAGSAFICEEYQHLLEGIENVSSMNFNTNKWMMVSFDCSILWVRDRRTLTQSMNVDPVYLRHRHSDDSMDLRHWGIPLSRRFRALKLWFVIRTYGKEGLQSYIRKHTSLSKQFENLVRADKNYKVTNDVQMGLTCFRINKSAFKSQISDKELDKMNEKLYSKINDSRKLHLTLGKTGEEHIIRFCVTSEHAEEQDLFYAWSIIQSFGREIANSYDSDRFNNNNNNESVVVNFIKTRKPLSEITEKMINIPQKNFFLENVAN